jgi:hypothetical protein
MKKIFIIGDYCKDWVLFEDSYTPSQNNFAKNSNLNNRIKSTLQFLPGGTLLLKKYLSEMMPEAQLFFYNEIDLETISSNNIIQTVALLKNFNNDNKNYAHVSQFLGSSGNNPSINIETAELEEFIKVTDLVLVDDSGKGMRDSEYSWLSMLSNNKNKFQIIVKLFWPLYPNKFFQNIVSRFGDKLIVVIDADDLREHECKISRQLSWDQTIEDFITEFPKNPHFEMLRNSKCIIIRFGLEAVLCVYNESIDSDERTDRDKFIYRLFYIPEMYEGEIKDIALGNMQGLATAFITAFTQQILYPYVYMQKEIDYFKINQPFHELVFSAIMPAMQAAINCFELGYSRDSQTAFFDYPVKEILSKKYSRDILVADVSNFAHQSSPRSLLKHLSFDSDVLINSVAFSYALNGGNSFLKALPVSIFNKMISFDKEEIEDFRGFRKMVDEYLRAINYNTPLSIAVFGPPGSGKSFAVKQIAKSMGEKFDILEYNLSQFNSTKDLGMAFQAIRDIALAGKMPLVIFDEFDCEFEGKNLGWLKYFLAPMQDGKFKEGELMHPIGRVVFIFAGGTSYSFEKFIAPMKVLPYEESDVTNKFSQLKGPDFVSRLRGFINIKGIEKRNDVDNMYPLRRAIVLRTLLKHYPNLIDGNKKIHIDHDLLSALLIIPEFKYGTRSLKAIVEMSDLYSARSFKKSNLPSDELLSLHIDINEFKKQMKDSYFPQEVIEKIAEEIHIQWYDGEIKRGSNKPSMLEWDKLSEDHQDSNRLQAMDILKKLRHLGYTIMRLDKSTNCIKKFSEKEIELLAEKEHERWMNEKISKGWTYGPKRYDNLKIHDCLLPWSQLDEKTKDLDRNTVKIIPNLLNNVGFGMVTINHQK